MHHLAAFGENIDQAGALVNIAAIPDPSITVQGDDVRVPDELPYLLGEAAALEATADVQAQVNSPSLRRLIPINIQPYDTGLVIDSGLKVAMHPANAVPLVSDESVNFQTEANPGAATNQYGLVWFGDGPLTPVTGEIYTVRCTMSVTAVDLQWVNGALTFPQDLPIGNYNVVGMRVVEATTVAGRLVFVGGKWRPGVQGSGSLEGIDNPYHRYGMMGVWGTFHTTNPPTVDILAAAGAVTPVVYLDIIPTA